MSYDPKSHHRRSIRLRGYDYCQCGAYFVTLRTEKRARLFGAVRGNNGTVGANNHSPNDSPAVELNDAGFQVTKYWSEIPHHFPFVELDAFIIMPDHVHGILVLTEHDWAVRQTRQKRANDHSPLQGTSGTIGSIVRGFKIGVTKWFRENHPGTKQVWQRNYYEHVIRSDQELNEVRRYIADNPVRAIDHPL